MSEISNMAYVHPNAKIGKDVTIFPFAYIDDNVEIGDGCIIRGHASILAGSRLGKNVKVYEGAVIAATPQDFRWKGDDSMVMIADDSVIREHVIINRSVHKDGVTKVGSHTFVMAQTHIGHDSQIGDYCVLGNSVKIAGNVKIGNYCILSSSALVHENCELAEWVLIKGGCRVNSHVPPYVIMAHNPITYYGVNAWVLEKGGKSAETIENIAKAYRHIYQSHTSAFNAIQRIAADIEDCKEKNAIMGFIRDNNYKIVALPIETDD